MTILNLIEYMKIMKEVIILSDINFNNEQALDIYFKAGYTPTDIHIKSGDVSIVRVTDRFLYCIDTEDITHVYNLDDVHAFHVDTSKVHFYEVTDAR